MQAINENFIFDVFVILILSTYLQKKIFLSSSPHYDGNSYADERKDPDMRKKSVETEKSACWKNRPLLPWNTKSKGGFQNSATTKAELSVARLLDLLLKRSKII